MATNISNPVAADETGIQLPSLAASLSLTFGLMSLLLLLTGWAPIITSFLAVLFGVTARSRIAKSRGGLTGNGRAGFGLFLGLVFLLMSVGLLLVHRMQSAAVQGWWKNGQPASLIVGAGGTPLERAERSILTGSTKPEDLGNNIQASGIAGQLQFQLQTKLTENFEGCDENKKIGVYCQQVKSGACLLIHVPELESFDESSRNAVFHLAWDEAQRASASLLDPGSELTVAIKDGYRYRSIQIGAVPEEDQKTDPSLTTVDDSFLTKFFKDKKKKKAKN